MGRPKSDLLSAFGTAFEILKGIMDEVIVLNGTDDDVRFILKNRKLRRDIAKLIIAARPGVQSEPVNIEYVIPLPDTDVPEQFTQTLARWHKLAQSLGYSGPVAWRIRSGFTLKSHAPKAGPCHDGFKYLQGWSLQNDEPTPDAIVFWVPRLIADSTLKAIDEQRSFMTDVSVRYELPKHHLTSFGSAALLSALVLAHYKLTGERVPLGGFWARSDTFHSGGVRLDVDFGESGLGCGCWLFDEDRVEILGAFPLGVELGL